MNAPYRAPAPASDEGKTAPRYVPMTMRRARLRRWVRSVPVPLLTGAALLAGRPWWIGLALAWGLADVVLQHLHEKALDARLKALAAGLMRGAEPEVAARGLEALVADSASLPVYHSVALLYLGIARGRAGDIDGALELLHVVHDSRWLEGRDGWQVWLLPTLCQLHAARGELDAAEQWLETGRRRLPPERHGALAGAEIVLALRRGRYDEALARIDATMAARKDDEASLVQLATLRAFARERVGRPLPPEDVERIVAASRATGQARVPLEKWWAELAIFIERHARPAA